MLTLLISVAKEPSTASALKTCMAAAASTLAMETCQHAALAADDADMDAKYRSVLGREPADQATKLRAAQALFLRFRDADCTVYFGSQTGSLAPVEAGDCLIGHTVERIRELGELGR